MSRIWRWFACEFLDRHAWSEWAAGPLYLDGRVVGRVALRECTHCGTAQLGERGAP